VKLTLFFIIGTLCGAAWVMHGTKGPSSAASPALPVGTNPVRLTPEQQLEAVRKNDALRSRLEKKYPDSYRELERQAKRDLRNCIVTQVLDNVLAANCPP